MPSGTSAFPAVISRIGRQRLVVIPMRVFEALRLRACGLVEVSAEEERLQMRPKCEVSTSENKP